MLPALAGGLAVKIRAAVDRTADYTRFACLAPHFRALAKHPNSPLLAGEGRGVRSAARTAFERALRILERTLPPEHPPIRIVRENLQSL